MSHRQEANSQTKSRKIWGTVDKKNVNDKGDTLVQLPNLLRHLNNVLGHGLLWFAVDGHGLPWFAVVCHGLQLFARIEWERVGEGRKG